MLAIRTRTHAHALPMRLAIVNAQVRAHAVLPQGTLPAKAARVEPRVHRREPGIQTLVLGMSGRELVPVLRPQVNLPAKAVLWGKWERKLVRGIQLLVPGTHGRGSVLLLRVPGWRGALCVVKVSLRVVTRECGTTPLVRVRVRLGPRWMGTGNVASRDVHSKKNMIVRKAGVLWMNVRANVVALLTKDGMDRRANRFAKIGIMSTKQNVCVRKVGI